MTLFALVLVWMTSLVDPERVPWADTYAETAAAIDDACAGEMRCAAVLVAIGYHESRFDPRAEGDRGQSVGVWQLSRHWLPSADCVVGCQARIARELVAMSFRICAARPIAERLGWYASGGSTCGRPASSRIRMRLAAQLMR